jgi:hypothetical protein
MVGSGTAITSSATLSNRWDVSAYLGANRDRWDNHALRGGPALRVDSSYDGSLSISTDPTCSVTGSLVGMSSVNPTSELTSYTAGPTLGVQALSNLDFSIGITWSRRNDNDQYVPMEQASADDQPVLAHIREALVDLTMRANYTVSPSLSIQAYAQSLIVNARYTRFKTVVEPDAADYSDRFGDAGAALAPDFTVRQLRTNLVLRWEYLPGSTLYVIWSHQRDGVISDGRIDLANDVRSLAADPSKHALIVKLSYWVGG